MNAQRRTAINKIIGSLNENLSELQNIAQEEQEAFDNMPESLQGGERGQKCEEAAQAIQEAADEIENQIANLEASVGE